jgi:RNA-directed DNA polymerase
MRQRQGAKTQGPSLMVAWQALPWKQEQRQVFRRQTRRDRATPRGVVRTARTRQQWLVKSWSARLLAVRRVPQDHGGKHTAGIEGMKSLTPPPRGRLAKERRLDGRATPLSRPWSPTRGSTAKRPRGMPTQHDRARQTRVRQALAPAWDAKLGRIPTAFAPDACAGRREKPPATRASFGHPRR